VVDVGGDDHAAGGNLVAHQLRCEVLPPGDECHLFGDEALASVVHLGEVLIAGLCRFVTPPRDPLGAGLEDPSGVRGAVAAVGLYITHGFDNSNPIAHYTRYRCGSRCAGRTLPEVLTPLQASNVVAKIADLL